MPMRTFSILCLMIAGFELTHAKRADRTSLAAEPTAQPTALVFSNVQSTSMTLTWTAAAPAANGYIVLRSTGSPSLDGAVVGVTYAAGNVIGSTTVAFVGAGVTFNDLSLTPATEYY